MQLGEGHLGVTFLPAGAHVQLHFAAGQLHADGGEDVVAFTKRLAVHRKDDVALPELAVQVGGRAGADEGDGHAWLSLLHVPLEVDAEKAVIHLLAAFEDVDDAAHAGIDGEGKAAWNSPP